MFAVSQPEITMLMRKLRLDKGFSQEQLAEATGLSLRTVQRVEAGHRVSYASLRALATVLDISVDSLERELYAMNTPNEEFIEKPLWVRLMLSLPSLSGLNRASLIRHELSLVGYAIFAFFVSFFLPRVSFGFWNLTTTDTLHLSAFSALFVAYVASVVFRLKEKFNVQTVPLP